MRSLRDWRSRAPTIALAASLTGACALAPRAVGTPPGLPLAWTADTCLSSVRDRDADGVDDDCELALAAAFAPELVVDPGECAWDASTQPPRLGGAYVFAAQRAPDGRAIRIAYMPAYFRDCGWDGVPCVTRGPDCAAHAGDSELIVVEARHDDSARWVTDGVFLSAHCFGLSDGRCRWYRGNDLRWFSWVGGVRGAPRVWVAKGKHANYPSPRECDTGHWYHDSCDANSVAYRFPVTSTAQNVGSRRHPWPAAGASGAAGCLSAERLAGWRATVAGTRECFWDPDAPFRGWQRDATGNAPTPYARVLRYAAGF